MKRVWRACSECGHLHATWAEKCVKVCCHTKMGEPVEVETCGDCFGEGGFKEAWDADRVADYIKCPTCQGRGVVRKT
jgi:DnaJ-class molecular chaperone